jgi:Domain of unknown function (DUF6265)
MKYILPLLMSVAFYPAQSQSVTANDFDKVTWLEGYWSRTNVKAGRTAHERWQKGNCKELIGFGVTMKEGDTVFMEKIKIVAKDNALYYVADVPENKQPVYFKMTAVTPTSFVCENPQHDFPKKIAYQLDGKNLKATTSGDGKSIDFLFVKN